MKTFLKTLKRQDGFTLVELMVVVAIIGLLSAVAIPNFKKYQAKAKMSEAKLQLSAAYTAETSFFSDYNLYANCLAYMGYDPSADASSRYYSMGFDLAANANPALVSTQWVSAINSGLDNAVCVGAAAGAAAGVSHFAAGKGVGAVTINTAALSAAETAARSALGAQAATASMTYTIVAAGVISGDNTAPGTASALSINQAKVISVIRNGY